MKTMWYWKDSLWINFENLLNIFKIMVVASFPELPRASTSLHELVFQIQILFSMFLKQTKTHSFVSLCVTARPPGTRSGSLALTLSQNKDIWVHCMSRLFLLAFRSLRTTIQGHKIIVNTPQLNCTRKEMRPSLSAVSFARIQLATERCACYLHVLLRARRASTTLWASSAGTVAKRPPAVYTSCASRITIWTSHGSVGITRKKK